MLVMGPVKRHRKEAFKQFVWIGDGFCCKRQCNKKFVEDDVKKWREFYHSLMQSQQREMLAGSLHVSPNADDIDAVNRTFFLMPSGTKPDITHDIGLVPVRVCLRYFLFFFFISRNKIYRNRLAKGRFSSTLRAFRDFGEEKRRMCVVWLHNLARYYTIMPNSKKIVIPVPTRRCVFRWYIEDCHEKGVEDIPSRSTFMKAWKSPQCSHIVLRRWLPFAQCVQCVTLSEKFRNRSTPEDERMQIGQELKDHNEYVRDLRDKYAIRCDTAKTEPHKYLSISIDAADQSHYGIPYFYRRSHAEDSMVKVPVHLMGAIVHGRRPYGFTFLENIKHGTNVTIECLHRIFSHIREQEGALPKILQIQMDNTCKQNKNKFMLGWMYYLVEIGTFDEVRLHFFPVGHTHADVDQMFSRLAVHLMATNSRCRAELLRCLENGFHMSGGESVYGEHLDRAANISDFIGPYLEDIKGISNYQMFKITKVDGVTCLEAFPTEQSKFSEGLTSKWSMFTRPLPHPTRLTVPHAQRVISPPVLISIMRKSLQRAIETRDLSSENVADIRSCIQLMEDDSSLEFDWDMNVYNVSGSVPRFFPQRENSHGWNIGDICLVCPAEECLQKEQFWIAQILRFTTLKNHPAVGVYWWENQSLHSNLDVLRGVFALNTTAEDTIFIESLVDKCVFTKQHRLSSSAKKKISYHVNKWLAPGNLFAHFECICMVLTTRCRQNQDKVEFQRPNR